MDMSLYAAQVTSLQFIYAENIIIIVMYVLRENID